MDEIIAVYNAIRTQSLAAKEQRFRLYYWKVLSIIVLFGFSMSDKLGQGIDKSVKTGLIALVIPILVALFDLTVKSRSLAIQRDGKLLMGLEDIIADKAGVSKHALPERFFKERRKTYWTAMNRLLESLAQFLFSVAAIVGSCYLYHKATKVDNPLLLSPLLLFSLSIVILVIYMKVIFKLLIVIFKLQIDNIWTKLKKEK